MIHGQAVAHPDHIELERYAPGLVDPVLDLLGDPPQVHVPGDELVQGVGYADERSATQVGPVHSRGPEERAVGRPGGPLGHAVATHGRFTARPRCDRTCGR